MARHTTILSAIATVTLFSAGAWATKPDAASLEFFETSVRPIFADHCYECHGAHKQKSGLRLDHISLILKGGDNGPAITPGRPDASRMIEAISYTNVDLQMPPKTGKISDAEIATLTKWVAMGAPWPDEPVPSADKSGKTFDLEARKAAHWSWRQVTKPELPTVKLADWPTNAIDRFILAKLEEKGLTPAAPAERRTLIRRLYFDITGLPPSPDEVDAFVGDTDPKAYEKLVDRLLASPAYGERWARHWMDLVRYAESRGHEFDYDAANAWQYRDYLIRAFNADVPYDQFVTEHIAGDLMPQPRTNPQQGFNESILGTGFWYLGEWVHSPVDIRKDETDRFDNMVDVMTKTFTGLTVHCARCHDHKFDAIGTADYYALFGYLQSTSYRQARFDTLDHNRGVAQRLADLHEQRDGELRRATVEAMRPTLAKLDAYLAGAVEAWASNPVAAVGETPDANKPRADIVYDDFELGSLDESKWSAHGKAFGQGPVAGTLPNQQAVSGFLGKYLINTYVGGDDSTGIATSKPFTIDRRYVRFLIGGGAHKDETCLNLVVGRKVVRTATGKENERLDPQAWDVSDLIGQQAQLQIVDRRKGPWGHINVDHIVFSDTTDAPVQASDLKITKAPDDATVVQVARRRNLDVALLKRWAAYLDDAAEHPEDPLYAFANAALRRGGNVTATVEPLVKKWRDLDAAYARSLEAANASVVVDYGELSADHWLQDGSAYGTRPKRPGDVQIGNDPTRPIERVFDAGMASRHPAWSKLKWAPGTEGEPGRLGFEKYGQMLRTPTYDLRSGRVYYLVRGKGTAFAAVDSHRMVQGPLHGETVAHFDTKGKWQWFSRQLDRYKDHRIHTEFVPDGDEPFEVRKVVVADNNPDVTDDANDVLLGMMTSGAAKSLDALAAGYRDTLLSVAGRFADGRLAGTRDGEDVAALADWLVGHSELFYNTSDAAAQALAGIAKPIVDEHTRVLADLKLASRLAPAMLEGDAEDEYTLIRGNSNTPGPITPRRFLEGISGSNQPIITSGSGRLELVQRMLDENDPYITRVMVNRIWHHLFGRGIVPSVDNFGVLGQAPTHPELLDWLAYTFRHDAQWSVKRMIKMMVMSSTYRQSSKPTNDTATAADPPNDLLHRMRVKRLEGEAIRDSVLAISGRLDSTMYGAPVPVHLTDFMTGRGRPGQNGPLDGAGRRSIYTSVRRNFLSPMMLAFDTPIPFNTIGRRATSNVPAQALILMNDPFVVQQAEVWAKRVLAEGGTAEQRVERMYTQAYARRPSQAELADALGFVDAQAKALNAKPDDPRVWTDLCHVMMNVKEFIFVN